MAALAKSESAWIGALLENIETPKGTFETLAKEKLAARALLKARLGEVSSNTYVPPEDRLTFQEVAKLWIDSKVRLRAASLSDYQTTLDCYLVPYFGPRKYGSITRLDIEKFRAEMVVGIPESVQRARDEKLRELKSSDPGAKLRAPDPGPRTTNKCLGVLISIGFYAVDHDLAIKNVAQRMEKVLEDGEGEDEDSEESVIEENVLTPSELARAIEAALDPWRVPIAMAAYCGLRQAEVLGLKWSDIDWAGSTAKIRRTLRGGVFSKSKAKASRRTIELPAPLIEELKRWRPLCPKNENDVVCPSVRGLLMQASATTWLLSSIGAGRDPAGPLSRSPSLPRPATCSKRARTSRRCPGRSDTPMYTSRAKRMRTQSRSHDTE